jgi:sporulation protein YlmC with PRC-barrel domain
MRASMIITVSALALLASPTFAQTSAQPNPAQPKGGMASSPTVPSGGLPGSPAPVMQTPAPDPLSLEDISQIKGRTVYGSDGKKIGDVSTVLMKPDSKTLDRLVVSEGGLLGVGSHRVALPLDGFKWDREKEGFTIAKTAAELKAMPEWQAASANTAIIPSSGSSQPDNAAAAGKPAGSTQ